MAAFDQGSVAELEQASSNSAPMTQVRFIPSTARMAVGGGVKRALDIVLAIIALIVFAPLFVLVAVAIRLTDPGPIFFGHERIGLGGRRFRCLKFRSMSVAGDRILAAHLAANPDARREWEETRKLKNDPRVSRLGWALRAYSVDELPQVINVLRGDMSFVGPRPVVDEELDRFGPNAALYLAARPGITGLWQVSGRSDTSYEERVALDSKYVTGWSLWGDLRIVLQTVPAVIGARGSY